MKKGACLILAIFMASISSSLLGGGQSGVSGGLSLLKNGSARALALGNTIGSLKNEVTAMAYNPASLASMKTGQASLLYEKGLTDDTYSQIMAGYPCTFGSLGVTAAVYNGGSFDWFDGTTRRDVVAQKDLILAATFAKQRGPLSWGLTGKYLSSELIETEQATAMALDLGVTYDTNPKLRWAASLQNFGTALTYIEDGDKLPRMARGGVSYLVFIYKYPTTLFLDLPYSVNESHLSAAFGSETTIGIMALRWGYSTFQDLGRLSVGAGLNLGPASLDYAFGLIEKLNSQQRVSFSYRFGGPKEDLSKPQDKTSTPEIKTTIAPIIEEIGQPEDMEMDEEPSFESDPSSSPHSWRIKKASEKPADNGEEKANNTSSQSHESVEKQ